MAGWAFDLQALTSVVPGFVPMQFVTAACFFFTGLILFALVSRCDDDGALMQFVLPTSTLLLLIGMIVVFAEEYLQLETDVAGMFVSAGGTVAGVPSLATMASFMLIAVAAEFGMIRPPGSRGAVRGIGFAVASIGFVALTGYATGIRELYFDLPSVSAAMAIHTALLFVVSGVILSSCVPVQTERHGP